MYGYFTPSAFTQVQNATLRRVHPKNWSYVQATTSLCFPFFVVELKAAAGTGGNLWDAANQCAGGAAACLQAVGQLNAAVRAASQGQVAVQLANVCYSLAMDNNVGQLYVPWKDSGIHMQRVAPFLLSDAEHFSRVYASIREIIQWGTRRL